LRKKPIGPLKKSEQANCLGLTKSSVPWLSDTIDLSRPKQPWNFWTNNMKVSKPKISK